MEESDDAKREVIYTYSIAVLLLRLLELREGGVDTSSLTSMQIVAKLNGSLDMSKNCCYNLFLQPSGLRHGLSKHYLRLRNLGIVCLQDSSVKQSHLDTIDNLAIAYDSQGKYRDAEDLYKQCLDKRKEVLGENHLDTVSAMNNLALTYGKQGKYRDAEVLLKQCLDKMKVILGESHPTTLATMSALAAIYSYQDKHRDAEVLLKQCLDKMKVVLGESHPTTLATMSALAAAYYNQGKYRDAEVLFKQCLDKRKVVLGERHPHTLDTMNSLALVTSKLK